jgi:hypothetical protein
MDRKSLVTITFQRRLDHHPSPTRSHFGSVDGSGANLPVWFQGGAQDSQGVAKSCTHWDSNLGKNYQLTVASP